VTMRLTCYSYSDWLIRQTPSGLPIYLRPSGRESAESSQEQVIAEVLPFSGARPPVYHADHLFASDHAPAEPKTPLVWSSTTVVDTAGWTEMVIQKRAPVLFHVITGHRAEVNASVNYVMEATLAVDLMHRRNGGGWSDPCTCGCPGRSEVNDNKFS